MDHSNGESKIYGLLSFLSIVMCMAILLCVMIVMSCCESLKSEIDPLSAKVFGRQEFCNSE